MKKRLCAAVMFGMATCLFAGCGGNGGGQSGEAVTDTETQAFLDYNVSDYVTLGEYKGLMVQYPVPTVSNEDVEMSIEELLEENTEYKKITIRGVESGDYLTIDFTGTIDGQEFDGGSAEDYEFVIGAEEFPQEFENNLLGKSAGETVTFQMVYPEDYEEEIAGKTAEFTVTVKAVSEMVVPEYNDEFVAKVTDYDTTEAYEEAMREELISDAQEEAAAGAGDEALSLAVGNATVSGYPQALYDACYNSTMEEYQQYADMFGMELDEFIRDFAGEDDLEGITVESVNEILVAQAIEEKEKLPLSMENRSVASITYQNLFLLFSKMAGMSGTLADASEELLEVYGRKVLVIPPNCPVKRKDLPDLYYQDAESQIDAAVCAALAEHETGRPVLIVVTTIGETELISEILVEHKIPHNVLNANNAFWEADIIREAGRKGAVTVATSMAGRGTDIRLTEDVKELGGLAVIGIGRMINIRQERQARGRAGRQGDAGSSQFFVSLQDDVMGEDPVYDKYIEGKRPISRGKLKKLINKAQRLGEENAVLGRKRSVDYDKVIQRQRGLIYATRNKLLEGEELPREMILKMAERNIKSFLDSGGVADIRILNRYILDNLSYRLEDAAPDFSLGDKKAIEQYLMEKVRQGLAEQEKKTGSASRMNQFIRVAVLSAIDEAWVEQVDYMQQLQAAVSGRATAQRNLLFEYQDDSFGSFRKMESTVYENAMRNILLSDIYMDEKRQLHIVFP